MNGADGVYRAHPRIRATHRGSDCNPAGYKSKFPLECSSTFHCSAVSFTRDILSEIAQCCRNLILAAERRFQPVAGFVRWSLDLWCPGAESCLSSKHLIELKNFCAALGLFQQPCRRPLRRLSPRLHPLHRFLIRAFGYQFCLPTARAIVTRLSPHLRA